MSVVAKRGDTLLEVVLAFVMFSIVAAISVALMNSSISGAEASIELTLARTEIDAQSETIRFVHEAYNYDRAYNNLWNHILKQLIDKEQKELPKLDIDKCSALYKDDPSSDIKPITDAKAFILNPRQVNNGTSTDEEKIKNFYGRSLVTVEENSDKFSASSLNPRIIYEKESTSSNEEVGTIGDSDSNFNDTRNSTDDDIAHEDQYTLVSHVEGIYDFLVKDPTDPSHYDFYVYTCWFAPGAERPTTIGTVTRLFNPEYVNERP